MKNEILLEIKALKEIIVQLIGTSELPAEEKFSKEVLDKAAKQFQKLAIEGGDWVPEDEISKYIKNAPYRSEIFIIEHFRFSNYFKRGRSYFFNKKSLILLTHFAAEGSSNVKV